MYAPQTCATTTLVQVAGSRWRIEQACQVAKSEVELDDYKARTARGWARHVTLALWSLVLLSVVRAHFAELPPAKSPGARAAGWPSSRPAAWRRLEPRGDPLSVLASGAPDPGRGGTEPSVVVPALPPSMGRPALSLETPSGRAP